MKFKLLSLALIVSAINLQARQSSAQLSSAAEQFSKTASEVKASALSSADLATETGKRVVRGVRTKVQNSSDRDVWVTWKAAGIWQGYSSGR